MNINGIEIINSQRNILRSAVHHELMRLQDNVGRATTDIAAEYCREQVRQCQGLLTLVTEQTTCGASIAAE
jgi:hypothetical protein